MRGRLRLRAYGDGVAVGVSDGREPRANLRVDLIDHRRDVLGQIEKGDAVERRAGIAFMQHGAPLEKACGGRVDGEIALEVDLAPGAPVAVGVVDVAAAREKVDAAGTAKVGASPLGEDVRVEDIAFEGAFAAGGGSQVKDFAEITGGNVEAAIGGAGERGDLVGTGIEQVGEGAIGGDGKKTSAIAGARDEASTGIKGEGVNNVGGGVPDAARRTIGSKAVDFRARRWRRESARERPRRQASLVAAAGNDSPRRWLAACGAAAFFADTRGIDVALLIDGERGDFFFRRAVEDEAFALRRDAVDEAAAVGSGDEVLLVVDGESADVGFVALEEDAALAAAIDTEDFAVIASGDVESALRVQLEVPDVLGFGFEENVAV